MPSNAPFKNKQTGEETPFLAGSRTLLTEAQPCPWQHIRIDLRNTPAYENPELITTVHVFGMKVDAEPSQAEWRKNGNWYEHTFVQGDVGIHPAGYVDKMRSKCGRESILATLDPEAVLQTCAGFEVPSDFEFDTRLALRDELITACLRSLLQEAQTGYTSGELYGDSVAVTLSAHYLLKYGTRKINVREMRGGLSKEVLDAVLEFIHANADQRLRLSELAAIAHLSPYHFSRLFKLSTGLSPYQYLMRSRVKMARRLMNKGEMSLKEVSRAVGFYDSSHFSRVFKRVTGVKATEVIRHVDE